MGQSEPQLSVPANQVTFAKKVGSLFIHSVATERRKSIEIRNQSSKATKETNKRINHFFCLHGGWQIRAIVHLRPSLPHCPSWWSSAVPLRGQIVHLRYFHAPLRHTAAVFRQISDELNGREAVASRANIFLLSIWVSQSPGLVSTASINGHRFKTRKLAETDLAEKPFGCSVSF